jgi:hypothetical protein
MKTAQRSAAKAFDKSADSHERTAMSYEKLAQQARMGPVSTRVGTASSRRRTARSPTACGRWRKLEVTGERPLPSGNHLKIRLNSAHSFHRK